ncbi:MAG: NusA-like transcription termination signal-binding factor [Methanocorpusculum sp.]|nr:NusA-like transcription termination signal-binding factor [Methanocorpusculum sp.]
MERSIGFKERRYIEELRILTKSTAVDCIIDDRFERIVYIIKPGDMGLAIGKGGDNIKKLSRVLGKRIEMVEYDENREVFVANMFKPANVVCVEFTAEVSPVSIQVSDRSNFGLAIGKGGSTIEKARLLVHRFYGREVGEITIAGDAL